MAKTYEVRFQTVDPNRRAAYVRMYKQAIQEIKLAGCRGGLILCSENDPGSVLVLLEWESKEHHLRWRGTPLPSWAVHRILNLETFLSRPGELMPLIEEVLAVQTLAGSPHHLVVLAHPWEFADLPIPGCGRANYDRLIERLELLSTCFRITVSGLSEIASRSAPAQAQSGRLGAARTTQTFG